VGSNLPINDPAVELERIVAAQIPDAIKQQMRSANLARLLSM